MKEIEMIVRPEKLEAVKKVLDDLGCGGLTLSTVMGCGAQKGSMDEEVGVSEIRGFQTTINLLPKIKIEVVVPDDLTEEVITNVREVCGTEHVGDGKIFIKTVDEVVRIRTGERGVRAL